MNKKTTTHLIGWFITLSVFWLILSGFLQSLLLTFGLISVGLVTYLIHKMNTIDSEKQQLSVNFAFLRYVTWLTAQIALSSLEVAKLVWGNNKSLSPATGKLPLEEVPKKSRVLYANSITLTPGTLSIDLDDEHVTVHALKEESIQDLLQGDMAQKVKSQSKGAN